MWLEELVGIAERVNRDAVTTGESLEDGLRPGGVPSAFTSETEVDVGHIARGEFVPTLTRMKSTRTPCLQ